MNRLLIVATAVVMATASQAALVLDNMTNATFTGTGSTPRAMLGQAFSLGNVAAGPVSLVGMDFSFNHFATVNTTYAAVQFQISFWNNAANTTTGTGAAFTNRVSTVTLNLAANTTLNASTRYTFQDLVAPGTVPNVTFAAPVTMASASNLGVQILILADSGNGLVANDLLTPALVHSHTGGAWAVGNNTAGTSPNFGYYRNASQASPANANTSLLGSDFRTLGLPTQGVAMRLYTEAVPEPGTMTVLGLGVAGLVARRRKNKKS